MITFTKVPEVRRGEAIASRQLRALAAAVNDRLPHFDHAWRVAWYVYSLFRAIRNPDSSGFLHPSQAEFFEVWQGLEEEAHLEPGEPEGANLANPALRWIYAEQDFYAEFPLTLNGRKPETPEEIWELAKLQRGAADPESGEARAPALALARAWYESAWPWSPHGNSYGGWIPGPVILGTCQDPDESDGIPGPPNYEIKFTPTLAGAALGLPPKIYAGTCPIGPGTTEDYSQHIRSVERTPWYYRVTLNNGHVDVLPRQYYVEGPYHGRPRLRKTEGRQLARALTQVPRDLRGPGQNAAARAALTGGRETVPDVWLAGAPDWQDFLTRQYALAPARGSRNAAGEVIPHYPRQRWEGNLTPGLLWLYPAAQGAVIGGWKITVRTALPVRLAINGSAEEYAPGVHLAGRRSDSQFRLDLLAPASGELEVELLEQVEYRPDVYDAMFCGRILSGARAHDTVWLDAAPPEHALVAGLMDPDWSLTRHPLFESFRRWSRYVRILPAAAFAGYAVEDGRSILWFRRYQHVAGAGKPVDRFAEFGVHEAAHAGYSQSWVLGVQLFPWHWSQSSLWKESAYGDLFTFNDRACFYAPEMVNEMGRATLWHRAFGQGVAGAYGGNLISESPTGHRYALLDPLVAPWAGRRHLNEILVPSDNFPDAESRRKFLRSARIYEPDLWIERVEYEQRDGEDLIKLTLRGRLPNTHGHPGGAPESLSRDVDSWDLEALQAEPWRTTENALRMYLANRRRGRNFTAGYGDQAANSAVQSLPDHPGASLWPHFYFVRGMPAPVEDDNDRQDHWDTPLYHDALAQAELYLRILCEACVDPEVTLDELRREVEANQGILPAAWTLADYTYESLCQQIAGTGWMPLLDSQLRPDNPPEFGVLPNTEARAEAWNFLARGWNRLTRYRLMLPWIFERRLLTWAQQVEVEVPFANNEPIQARGYKDFLTPLPVGTLISTGDWEEDLGATVSAFFSLDADPGLWQVALARVTAEWRVQIAGDYQLAIPEPLAELLTGQLGLLAWQETSWNDSRRVPAEYPEGYEMPDGRWNWVDGPQTGAKAEAFFARGGVLSPPPLPGPTDAGYYHAIAEDPVSPGGSSSFASVSIIPGDTLFFEVPLVEPAA